MKLTQPQLNAGSIISALATMLSCNIDPKYGYGKKTLEIVIDHISFWDQLNEKNQAIEYMKELIKAYEEREKC